MPDLPQLQTNTILKFFGGKWSCPACRHNWNVLNSANTFCTSETVRKVVTKCPCCRKPVSRLVDLTLLPVALQWGMSYFEFLARVTA